MNEELEMLELDGLDLEEIERATGRYPYPVVSVQKNFIYFNKAFSDLMNGNGYIKFYTTPEYVILELLPEKKGNSFRLARTDSYRYAVIPVNLKEKRLQIGPRKVYKCKRGFAFKRYELLEKVPS